MAINSSKVDEEQKEVLKSATIRRLFSYLKNYKRQGCRRSRGSRRYHRDFHCEPAAPGVRHRRQYCAERLGAGLLPSAYSWL